MTLNIILNSLTDNMLAAGITAALFWGVFYLFQIVSHQWSRSVVFFDTEKIKYFEDQKTIVYKNKFTGSKSPTTLKYYLKNITNIKVNGNNLNGNLQIHQNQIKTVIEKNEYNYDEIPAFIYKHPIKATINITVINDNYKVKVTDFLIDENPITKYILSKDKINQFDFRKLRVIYEEVINSNLGI